MQRSVLQGLTMGALRDVTPKLPSTLLLFQTLLAPPDLAVVGQFDGSSLPTVTVVGVPCPALIDATRDDRWLV
jgi:hypothetical protein